MDFSWNLEYSFKGHCPKEIFHLLCPSDLDFYEMFENSQQIRLSSQNLVPFGLFMVYIVILHKLSWVLFSWLTGLDLIWVRRQTTKVKSILGSRHMFFIRNFTKCFSQTYLIVVYNQNHGFGIRNQNQSPILVLVSEPNFFFLKPKVSVSNFSHVSHFFLGDMSS